MSLFFFFFNDTATTEIYTLSLHDALPIYNRSGNRRCCRVRDGQGSGRADNIRRTGRLHDDAILRRSEEHTSELHHLVISYAVFCLKKKKQLTKNESRCYQLLCVHTLSSPN